MKGWKILALGYARINAARSTIVPKRDSEHIAAVWCSPFDCVFTEESAARLNAQALEAEGWALAKVVEVDV